MKIKYINNVVVCCLFTLLASSCSDFLNNDLDGNQETIEQVFKRQKTTEQYLANVYSYMRPQNAWSNEAPWTAISDELDVTYPDYTVSLINLGSLTPDKGWFDTWAHYYKGIRSATYFMQHVDNNIELSNQRIQQYKAEAQYLRAWYYFCLIRQYGPVVIIPEKLIAPEATIEEMTLPRNTIKESFDYVISELDSIVKLNVLPDCFSTAITDYGRITNATCKALKSRATLYAASDFYNSDINTIQIFKDFVGPNGKKLLDYTGTGNDAARIARWQAAADAAKAVINMRFELYKSYDDAANTSMNPYTSYQSLFTNDWSDQKGLDIPNPGNSEVIFAKMVGGFWEMDMACSPRFVGGWSGWAPTQKIVDAYFTKNGLTIDKDPAYTEQGLTGAVGDNGYTQKNTLKMYANREPRFYMSICFSNSKWLAANDQTQVQLYYGGNSGLSDDEKRNYSQTGYLCRKLVHPSSNLRGSKVEHMQIYFRLGEIYLNYVEALNEVSYSNNLNEILTYLNKIRERAGIPVYGNGAGEVAVPANQEDMRTAIRRERQVELAFEEHRYFDCIRWGIAKQEFSGDFKGMTISQGLPGFYTKQVFETRKFDDKNYFWPIALTELYKGKQLVQNPGWGGK